MRKVSEQGHGRHGRVPMSGVQYDVRGESGGAEEKQEPIKCMIAFASLLDYLAAFRFVV